MTGTAEWVAVAVSIIGIFGMGLNAWLVLVVKANTVRTEEKVDQHGDLIREVREDVKEHGQRIAHMESKLWSNTRSK